MPPARLSLPQLMGTLYRLNSTPCLPQTDTLCFPHQTDHLVLMTTFLRNISEHLLLLQRRYLPFLNLFYHSGLLLGLSISCFDPLSCNFPLAKCSLSKTHYSLSWYRLIDPHCRYTVVLRLGCTLLSCYGTSFSNRFLLK